MRRTPIILLSVLTAALIATAAGIAEAPASSPLRVAQPRPTKTVTVTSTSTVTETATQTVTATETVTAPGPTVTVTAPGPTTTVTVTATPTSTPTDTGMPTPTPTPTTTAPGGWACTAPLGSGCPQDGAYVYAGIPNSNGYNTYVTDQDVGANSGTAETLNANNPGDWQIIANDVPYGETSVQTFPDVQQLFNNWCGTSWTGCDTSADTPLNSLSALKVNYAETSPTSANSIYEYAPDIWQDNYPSDVMFWVDTKSRCNEGAFGSTVLGHAVLDGQNWTVHRYGGPGAEIIFVLDGAGGSGTCAQQSSGSVNIKAGLNWLVANGFETGPAVLGQVNTGWEITSADNTTFTVSQYSITAVPN